MTRIPLIDEDIETCGDGCDTWIIIHTIEDQEQLKKQILDDYEFYEKTRVEIQMDTIRGMLSVTREQKKDGISIEELEALIDMASNEIRLGGYKSIFDECLELKLQEKKLKEKAEKWDNHDKEYCDLKECREKNKTKFLKLAVEYKELEQENKQLKDGNISRDEHTLVLETKIEWLRGELRNANKTKEIVQKVRGFHHKYELVFVGFKLKDDPPLGKLIKTEYKEKFDELKKILDNPYIGEDEDG